MYKYGAALVLSAGLLACAQPPLATDPAAGLPDADRELAQQLAQRIPQECMLISANDLGVRPTRRGHINPPQIFALYKSTTPWVKVDAFTSGIWMDYYHHTETKQSLCSQRSWERDPKLQAIVFERVKRLTPASVP